MQIVQVIARFMAGDWRFRIAPLEIDWVDEHWAEELRVPRAAALEAAFRAAARASADKSWGDRAARSSVNGRTPWVEAGRLRSMDRTPR